MNIHEAWQSCIGRILKEPASVLVIGEGTSGKTSFVSLLAKEGFKSGVETAVLDMDVGQSNIGPPTTIGLGFVKNEINALSEIKPKYIYFIGNTSPLGKEKEFASGLKEITSRVRTAELLIVESVALLNDRDFRSRMLALEMEILSPKYVVVLKFGADYEENSLPGGGRIFSLPGVVKKGKRNLVLRKKFRAESWIRYLKGGERYYFNKEDPKIRTPRIGVPVGITNGKTHLGAGVIFEEREEVFSVFGPKMRTKKGGDLDVIIGEVKVEPKVLNFIKEYLEKMEEVKDEAI